MVSWSDTERGKGSGGLLSTTAVTRFGSQAAVRIATAAPIDQALQHDPLEPQRVQQGEYEPNVDIHACRTRAPTVVASSRPGTIPRRRPEPRRHAGPGRYRIQRHYGLELAR